jgi:hypothetical protein
VNEKQNTKPGYRLSKRQEDNGDLSAYVQRVCQIARSSDVTNTRAALAVAMCLQQLTLEPQRAAACRGLVAAKVTTAKRWPVVSTGHRRNELQN